MDLRFSPPYLQALAGGAPERVARMILSGGTHETGCDVLVDPVHGSDLLCVRSVVVVG